VKTLASFLRPGRQNEPMNKDEQAIRDLEGS